MEHVDTLHTAFLAFLLLLQVLDMHSTHTALKSPKLREANPFVRKMIDKFGTLGGMLVLKVPAVALIWFFLDPSWVSVAILALLCVFYSYIVGKNYMLIRKHG